MRLAIVIGIAVVIGAAVHGFRAYKRHQERIVREALLRKYEPPQPTGRER